MDNSDGTFTDTSPDFQTQGSGGVEAASSASSQFHMRRTRGSRCNAGRALPAAGREHAGRGRPLEVFPDDGTKEEETVPSPRRSQTAASPRPSRFLEPSAWRGAPRRRMRSGERGRGAGPLIANSRRHGGSARPLLCPPPETSASTDPPPAPLPSALPFSESPMAHLGDLPLQTLR